MFRHFNRAGATKALLATACAALIWMGVAASASAADAPPQRFVAEHRAVIGGHSIRYQSVVEEVQISAPDGKKGASIFTFTYLRTDAPKNADRPVLFVFNGGPGSASLWLHMGLVGPKRVDLDNIAKPKTIPPFRLLDNPDSPLDVADIVLIDPPGTGFSRLLPDGKPEQFYSAKGDAQATAKVIESWVRTHNRWNSPKYLVSESYGTVRAALVARALAGGPFETGAMNGITLNGVILLGQSMDMGLAGDVQYVNSLPSLAAVACYFGRVQPNCNPVDQAEAARRFGSADYVQALYRGEALEADRRSAVAHRLSELIGLPENVIEAHDLRVTTADFAKLLLADKGQELGMYDARYTLPLASSGKDPVADDPAMGQYAPGFVAAFNQYAHDDLRVKLDAPYRVIAFRDVNARWDYGLGPGVPPSSNFALDLAVAMRRNPSLRIMVGCGLYDLVTTMGSAEYTITHAGIPLDRTIFHYYASGHMPYLGAAPRKQLATDIRAFVTRPGQPVGPGGQGATTGEKRRGN